MRLLRFQASVLHKQLVSSFKNSIFGHLSSITLNVDSREYYTDLKSKTAKYVARQLLLRNKKTGETLAFPIYQKPYLPEFMHDAVVTNFDVNKLEIEYDYDTDDEQKARSKNMLLRELTQAIDFYVQEDPLKLVDNVLLRLRP